MHLLISLQKKGKGGGSEGRRAGGKAKAEEQQQGGKKKRAKKDKNAPKGALASYMFFSKEERLRVKAEQPSLSLTDASKVLGERWKALSADEKKPFEELARADKER